MYPFYVLSFMLIFVFPKPNPIVVVMVSPFLDVMLPSTHKSGQILDLSLDTQSQDSNTILPGGCH